MLYLYNISIRRETDTRETRDDALFKALGDARRRRILDLLKNGALTTGELCRSFPRLDRCSVMQHLGVLQKSDLVIVKREGRLRWNYFNPVPIRELHNRWISRYAGPAVDVLAEMKRGIER